MFLLMRCLLVTLDCFQWPVSSVSSFLFKSSRSSWHANVGRKDVDDSMKSDVVFVTRKGEYYIVD